MPVRARRSAQSPPSSANWLAILLVIVLPIAVLRPVCDHGFTSWDDRDTVETNPTLNPVTWHSVRTWWTTTKMDLYVPVTYTAWGIIALRARVPETATTPAYLNPIPFHTANLVLHVLCCLVVFELLRMLIGKAWPAALGALIFGLHPVQVEAVAWVSGLKDVLGGLLALVAIWQYLVAVKRDRLSWRYGLATVAFVLAMLAKPNELVVPVIAGIIDVMLMRRPWRVALRWLWPWFLLSAACVAEGWMVQSPVGVAHNVAIYLRPLVAVCSLGFYAGKLIWPTNLAVDYGLQPSVIVHARWLVAGAAVIVVGGVVLWLARRSARPVVAGALVFVAALGPVLGFITFDFQWFSNVADHYLYLPMFGVALVAAWMAARWSGWPMAAGAAAVLAGLGAVSYQQTQYWVDSPALFHRVEAVNPNSAAAADALALDSLSRGDARTAHRWAQETIRLRPDSPLGYIADAMALSRLHQPQSAIEQYRKSLEFDAKDAATRNDLATLLAETGQMPEAENQARRAISLDPNFAGAHFNLGTILLRRNKIPAAIDELKEAVRLDPHSEQFFIVLANVLAVTGHRAEALEEYEAALRMDPQSSAARQGRDRMLGASGQ
jgi:Tfp pilus assembly protein PilF